MKAIFGSAVVLFLAFSSPLAYAAGPGGPKSPKSWLKRKCELYLINNGQDRSITETFHKVFPKLDRSTIELVAEFTPQSLKKLQDYVTLSPEEPTFEPSFYELSKEDLYKITQASAYMHLRLQALRDTDAKLWMRYKTSHYIFPSLLPAIAWEGHQALKQRTSEEDRKAALDTMFLTKFVGSDLVILDVLTAGRATKYSGRGHLQFDVGNDWLVSEKLHTIFSPISNGSEYILQAGPQIVAGAHMSSFEDLFDLITNKLNLEPGDRFVDIFSADARLGLILLLAGKGYAYDALLFNNEISQQVTSFLEDIEVSDDKFRTHSSMAYKDLPEADHYFINDTTVPQEVSKTLCDEFSDAAVFGKKFDIVMLAPSGGPSAGLYTCLENSGHFHIQENNFISPYIILRPHQMN